jgi:hypothetical protein
VRCGATSGLDSASAFARSKLLAYSKQDRTPWRSIML